MKNTIRETTEPKNPPHRMPIRSDFPPVVGVFEPKDLLATLLKEIKKTGIPLWSIPRIQIAFPQKDKKQYAKHVNHAEKAAITVKNAMEKALLQIQWVLANGIYEDRKLFRIFNQASFDALTEKQTYHTAPNKKIKGELFIMVDHCMEQGTTLAHLQSYLTFNGGIVLGAVAGSSSGTGAGKSFAATTEKHRALAQEFSNSAARLDYNWTPETCLKKFDSALKKHSNSLLALTDGECNRLIETVRGEGGGRGSRHTPETFPVLLKLLQATP